MPSSGSGSDLSEAPPPPPVVPPPYTKEPDRSWISNAKLAAIRKERTYELETYQSSDWEILLEVKSEQWPNFTWTTQAREARPEQDFALTDIDSTSGRSELQSNKSTFADLCIRTSRIIQHGILLSIPVALIEFKAQPFPPSSKLWDKALAQVITNARDRLFEGSHKELRRGIPAGYTPGKLAKHRPILALSVVGSYCRRVFVVDEKTAYVDVDREHISKRSRTNPVLPSCTPLDWPIRLDIGTPGDLIMLDHFLQLANAHADFIQSLDASGPHFVMMYDLHPLDSYLAGLKDSKESLATVDLPSAREAIADITGKKKSGTNRKRKASPAGDEGPSKTPHQEGKDPGGAGSGEGSGEGSGGGGYTRCGGSGGEQGQGGEEGQGGAPNQSGEEEQGRGGRQAQGDDGGQKASDGVAGVFEGGDVDCDGEWVAVVHPFAAVGTAPSASSPTPPKVGHPWMQGIEFSASTGAVLPQPSQPSQPSTVQPAVNQEAEHGHLDLEDALEDADPEDYLLTPEELEILGSMSIRPINEMTDDHKRLILSVHGAQWEAAARIVFPETFTTSA
jgi:uncharacterized membrane protein YgcG